MAKKKSVKKSKIEIVKTKNGEFKVIKKGKSRIVSREEIIKIAKKHNLILKCE